MSRPAKSPHGMGALDNEIRPPWPQATGASSLPVPAGIPAEVAFATKPELALDMITGTVAAGMPAAWVAADELYGDNSAFRAGVAKLGPGICAGGLPRPPGPGLPRDGPDIPVFRRLEVDRVLTVTTALDAGLRHV
jgi:hypothetical protein